MDERSASRSTGGTVANQKCKIEDGTHGTHPLSHRPPSASLTCEHRLPSVGTCSDRGSSSVIRVALDSEASGDSARESSFSNPGPVRFDDKAFPEPSCPSAINSDRIASKARGDELIDEWTPRCVLAPPILDFMVGPEKLESVRKLKTSILAFASCGDFATLSVHGSGGVGKTTACIIVANDDDVRRSYPDGILWVELGDGSAISAVVEQVATIVQGTGGYATAQAIREEGESDLWAASIKAAKWFKGRRILLVVDNVFPSKFCNDFGGWIGLFQQIPGNDSCLLFSTRSNEIATQSDKQIEFKALDATQSHSQKEIFMAHLRIPESNFRFNGDGCAALMSKCHGLPIALASAAALVRFMHHPWSDAVSHLQQKVLEAEYSAQGGHEGLAAVYCADLNLLDEQGENFGLRSHPELTWSELYVSLHVLDDAQPRIAISVLSCMWDVDVEFAENICTAFANLSLCSLSDCAIQADRILYLHDLQLEYCKRRAFQSSLHNAAVPRWHDRMILNFIKLSNAGETSMNNSCFGHNPSSFAAEIVNALESGHIPVSIEDYFLDHIIRHLCGMANGAICALHVLTDYRWLKKVAARRSLATAARAYELFIGMQKIPGEVDADILAGLSTICNVLRNQVHPEAAKAWQWANDLNSCSLHKLAPIGDPGLAHQLVGRLGFLTGQFGQTGNSKNAVIELLRSIDAHARKPWLRPVNSCFNSKDLSGTERVIALGTLPYCAASFLDGCVDAAAVAFKESILVYDISSGECYKELRFKTTCEGETVTSLAVGHSRPNIQTEEKVLECACNIIAGFSNGIIRIWSPVSMSAIFVLEGHCEKVDALEASLDLARIISWSKLELSMRVWEQGPSNEWRCQAIIRCESIISYFCGKDVLLKGFSGDTMPITSSDERNSLLRFSKKQRITTVVSHNNLECILRRNLELTHASTDNDVYCSQLCPHESNVEVFLHCSSSGQGWIGRLNPSTAEVFNKTEPFEIASKVLCMVAFRSAHDNVVATGHADGSMQCRLVKTGRLIHKFRRGHTRDLIALGISASAHRIVSISKDRSLKVWSLEESGVPVSDHSGDTTSNQPVHSRLVSWVNASRDGVSAVSWAYRDSTICVWNVLTGEPREKLSVPPADCGKTIQISHLDDWVLDTDIIHVPWDDVFLGINPESGRSRVAAVEGLNDVSSVAVSRNGHLLSIVGRIHKRGVAQKTRQGVIWDIKGAVLDVKHVGDAGTKTASELLLSYIASLGLRASEMKSYLPAFRTAEEFEVGVFDSSIHVWRSIPNPPSEGVLQKSSVAPECSCPARARYDASTWQANICVIPRRPGAPAHEKRIAIAGLSDGRVAFMHIEE